MYITRFRIASQLTKLMRKKKKEKAKEHYLGQTILGMDVQTWKDKAPLKKEAAFPVKQMTT